MLELAEVLTEEGRSALAQAYSLLLSISARENGRAVVDQTTAAAGAEGRTRHAGGERSPST